MNVSNVLRVLKALAEGIIIISPAIHVMALNTYKIMLIFLIFRGNFMI